MHNIVTLPAEAERRAITAEQWNTLTNVFFPDASPEMALLAWDYCKAKGIDPMLKPVHVVAYGGKAQIVPGIGLYRTIAARTGEWAGSDKPEYEDIGGGNLQCTVTVYRIVKGHRCPFVGQADMKEFNKNHSNWRTMPRHMLAIRAESDALRKAFPEDCGHEPTYEELQQPSPMRQAKSVQALEMQEIEATFDPETGEVIAETVVNQDPYASRSIQEWNDWAHKVSLKIGKAKDLNEVNSIYNKPQVSNGLDWLKSQDDNDLQAVAGLIEEAAASRMEMLS